MIGSRRVSGSTTVDVMSPRFTDTTKPAVIHCDGFGASVVQSTHPFGPATGSIVQTRQLVEDGFTVYKPFSGDCWGHPSYSSATVGSSVATGLQALTDARTLAVADGFGTTVNLVGFSAGGLDAMSWAMQNPTLTNKLYLHFPAFSIESIADDALLEASVINAWGASYVAASVAADPYQQDALMDVIGPRIRAMGSPEDDLINWTLLEAWCAARGIYLQELTGEHGAQVSDSRFSYNSATEWFTGPL